MVRNKTKQHNNNNKTFEVTLLGFWFCSFRTDFEHVTDLKSLAILTLVM